MNHIAVGNPGWTEAKVFDLDECHYLTTVVEADDETGHCIEYLLDPQGSPIPDASGKLMVLNTVRNILVHTP